MNTRSKTGFHCLTIWLVFKKGKGLQTINFEWDKTACGQTELKGNSGGVWNHTGFCPNEWPGPLNSVGPLGQGKKHVPKEHFCGLLSLKIDQLEI